MRRAAGAVIVVLIVAAVLVAWRTGYFDATRLDTIRAVVSSVRQVRFAPALYVLAYVLAVLLLLPTTALSLIGGALFGMPALALSWVGALLGSAGAHSLGRYTGRRPVRRFLGNHAMLRRLRDDASIVDLIRLRVLPVAPYGLMDYLAGMSAIKLHTLLIATAIAIVPTKAAYVFAGRQVAIALEGGASATRALLVAGIVTVSLLLVAIAPTIAKLISRRGAR
jgi:uncharacterized membrane protein YdjX (TVP38/TMEM64 family)